MAPVKTLSTSSNMLPPMPTQADVVTVKTPPLNKAFISLPIEINQQIAGELDTDKDICTFRLICRYTHDAIDADGCSFWRRRFLHIFETPNWPTAGSRKSRLAGNEKFRDEYKKRKDVLKNGTLKGFCLGLNGREIYCIEVIRDMLIECYSDKTARNGFIYESNNLAAVLRFVDGQTLLNIHKVLKGFNKVGHISTANPMFLAIKCLLAPTLLSFSSVIANDIPSYPDSQKLAYDAAVTSPIFGGCNGVDINWDWLYGQISYWRQHLVHRDETALRPNFEALEQADRPRYWTSQLSQTPPTLARNWKGSYAYVDRDEIKSIRAGKGQTTSIADVLSGEGQADPFQHICLKTRDPVTSDWPREFEEHLKSLAAPVSRARTRAQKHSAGSAFATGPRPQSIRFDGKGYDVDEDFKACGWLNPLPAQHGIPGWQRMTMMKYFIDEDTAEIDYEALWAYEGVMLPGGQIMLGRWWCPADGDGLDMYSGPFILWHVDDAKYDTPKPTAAVATKVKV